MSQGKGRLVLCGTVALAFSAAVATSCRGEDRDFGSGGHSAAGGGAGDGQAVIGGEPSTPGGTSSTGGAPVGGDGSAAMAGTDGCQFSSCDCSEGLKRACGPTLSLGICHPGEQTCTEGAWGECVGAIEALPRDCMSALDNDCDGSPDNTLDDECTCQPGAKEACGEHPDQDGKGICTAGERECMPNGASGVWGTCVGSVGPKAADSCELDGDDSDCDGKPNGGCDCVSGEASTCGSEYTSKGECAAKPLTCGSSGKWPAGATCTTSQSEVCAADMKDENCDGQVNEGCACTNGALRCAGYGGTQKCVNGQWAAAVTPCAATAPACSGAGVCGSPQSCKGVAATCAGGNCCSSVLVPQGNFDRWGDPSYPAHVSAFRLDTFEVTVARFRKFVSAYSQTMIQEGAGKNPNNVADTGWDKNWDSKLPASAAVLTNGFASCSGGSVYNLANNDNKPINCVTWYVANAFCAWDGGRLPTQSEWMYVAAHANEQRSFPWGTTPGPSYAPDLKNAVHGCLGGDLATCEGAKDIMAVGTTVDGKSFWGHFDMAGNVGELTFDGPDGVLETCNDCSATDPLRAVLKGGYYHSYDLEQYQYQHTERGATNSQHGFRCARDP